MTLDFETVFYPRQPSNKVYDLEAMRKDYHNTFSCPHGQLVLADIIQRGSVHTVSFTGESPLSTAFNEGKRALALEIIYMLNPNPVPNIYKTTNGGYDDGTINDGNINDGTNEPY